MLKRKCLTINKPQGWQQLHLQLITQSALMNAKYVKHRMHCITYFTNYKIHYLQTCNAIKI